MFNNQEKETILKKLAERYGKEYQNSWQQDLIDNVLVFNPKEALRLIYRDFAFVRAGGERAGYGRIAQQALEEFEGESIPDPNQLWERFKAICIKEKLGVNQRLNSGVVKGLAKLASNHGNLFNWIKKEVETNGRLAPLALTLMNINGIGFKIVPSSSGMRSGLSEKLPIRSWKKGLKRKSGFSFSQLIGGFSESPVSFGLSTVK